MLGEGRVWWKHLAFLFPFNQGCSTNLRSIFCWSIPKFADPEFTSFGINSLLLRYNATFLKVMMVIPSSCWSVFRGTQEKFVRVTAQWCKDSECKGIKQGTLAVIGEITVVAYYFKRIHLPEQAIIILKLKWLSSILEDLRASALMWIGKLWILKVKSHHKDKFKMTETFLHCIRWSVEAVLSGSGHCKFFLTNSYVQVLYPIFLHGTVTHDYKRICYILFLIARKS